MVKELEIRNVDGQGGGGSKMNERQLKSFFSALGNLEQLILGLKTTSLVDVVLSLRIARSEVPSMKYLEIQIPVEWKKPFDSKIYRYLNEYPALYRLSISTNGSQTFVCSSKGGGKLTKITELGLKGIFVDDSKTLSFLNNFPHLSSLTLDTSDSHHPSYPELVSVLPLTLTSLTLLTRTFYDGYSEPCDQHLPRLINLEYLYLGEGTFTENLINPLHKLPKLKTLGFGKGAVMDIPRLEEIILGPNRLPLLEKVVFDQFEGKVGWSIQDDSDGMTLHPDHKKDYHHLGPGWVVPRPGSCMSGRNFDDLLGPFIKKIKDAKLQIEGTTLDALKVWKKWELEIVMCEFAYALEVGNTDEMRERYGDEYVQEFEENWGWDYDNCGEY
jgi:hypothetical protein